MIHSILNLPLIIQDTAAVEGMGMLWMLLSGILVFFMQAGFTLVETGMTQSKNAVNIAMKNFRYQCRINHILACWIFTYVWRHFKRLVFWSGLFKVKVQTYFSNNVCSNSCNNSFRCNSRENKI